MEKEVNNNYYVIQLSFETTTDVLNDNDESISSSRKILFDRINNLIDREEKYDVFSRTVINYELPDTYNQMISFYAYFRSIGGLPMEEYISARDIRDKIKNEFINFLESVGCEYRIINIKTIS